MRRRIQSLPSPLCKAKPPPAAAPDWVMPEPPAGLDLPGLEEPPPVLDAFPGRGEQVALATCGMEQGGAEVQTVTLAVELQRLGYSCAVLNTGARVMGDNPLVGRLRRAGVRYMEGDVASLAGVEATIWWGNSLSPFAAAGKTIPGSIYVVHSAGAPTVSMLHREAPSIKQGAVVAVSGPAARLAEMVLQVERVPVIWNGIEPTGATTARPGPGFTVGTLGRYSPEKNIPAALAALRYLPRQVRLRSYGWGPLRTSLQEAAHRYGVEDRFDLCGRVPGPEMAFPDFDCLLLCSVFEGLPMTVVEAMHAGVPVVACPLGDLPLILAGGRGTLCGPSPREIAEAVERFIRDGSDVDAAQAFARRHLSARAMAAGYTHQIAEVLA
ncbi:MAG: hypothetical protein CMK74_00210 [Pseudomonadales bacterium]|nr:hypothetical protein [Pseudomonadales bacterium]